MSYDTGDGAKRIIATAVVITALAAVSVARAQARPMPSGWTAVNANGDYILGTEPGRRAGGNGWVVATIKSKVAEPARSATLQQSIKANEYLGKRMRLTGWIKTAETNIGGAHLFMRVDGDHTPLASDYMIDRPVTGRHDWQQYSVVLHVPKNAVGITIGIAMEGGGQMWVDDLTFEQVGDDVPTTGREGGILGPESNLRQLHEAYVAAAVRPRNLDFELRAVAAR